MLRDSKLSHSAAPSMWQPARLAAVGLLVIGAALVAGLRGGPSGPLASVASAQPPAAPPAAPASKGTIDLAHVNNDATMLLAIRPAAILGQAEIRQALEAPAGGGAPLLSLARLEGLEQVTLIGLPGTGPDDWNADAIAVLQFRQPATFADVAKAGDWPGASQPLPLKATGDQPAAQPGHNAYAQVNDETLAIAKRELLEKYLGGRRKGQPAIAAGPAWDKVRAGAIVAALDMEIVRDQMRKAPPGAGGAPDAALASLSPLWTDSEYALAGVIVEGQVVHLRAIATCHDAALAENVADTAQAANTMARNLMRSARENQPGLPAFARYILDTADGLLKSVKVERQETLVVAQTKTDLPKASTAAAGQLLGAISQARSSAQRAVSANNMKQIMLAMHNWADVHGRGDAPGAPGGVAGAARFPPPVIMGRDGKGKVPHSWRVELLPYLEQAPLYEAYHFDEPWDSEANKLVLAQMPAQFRHPQDDPKSTNAAYFVLRSEKLLAETPVPGGAAGPEGGFATAFSDKNGMSFAQIHDGTSNTIAVVEAKRDIPWTRPEDILFDPAKDPPTLGGFFKEGFTVGLCDGSARFLDAKIDSKILKLLITPQDGQPVPQF